MDVRDGDGIGYAAMNRYAQGGAALAPMAPAVQTLQSAARAPDTQLAHISPDEAAFIDNLQGGRRVNPMTGLPEYSMFGNILKAVARAAAGIGGFMVGGPAGAAAASGAATKLTGGSWKEALGSAALSGIGSLGAQGLTGGGWNPLGQGGSSAYTNLAGTAVPASTAPGFLQVAKSAPGIAAAFGGMSQPLDHPSVPAMPSGGGGSSIHLNDVVPQPRTFQPYQGDPTKYADPNSGGAGHVFYSPLNPVPKYRTPDDELPLTMAGGGAVAGLQGPNFGPRGLRGGGIDMPEQPGGQFNINPPGLGVHTNQLRQAAMAGYQMAKSGGAIRGPGTGTSDSIPAQLSAGEHVWDEATTTMLGDGNNEVGQQRMEKLKQRVRAGHGVPNPKKPPAFQGAERAKKRAGMK